MTASPRGRKFPHFCFWSLAVGYGLIIVVVASLYRNVKRYGQQSAEAEERLSLLNGELDQRVRERTALLKTREEQLRALAGSLLNAQEDERRRVARELHDDVTQRLAFLSIELGKLVGEIRSFSARLGTAAPIAKTDAARVLTKSGGSRTDCALR